MPEHRLALVEMPAHSRMLRTLAGKHERDTFPGVRRRGSAPGTAAEHVDRVLAGMAGQGDAMTPRLPADLKRVGDVGDVLIGVGRE